MSVAILEVRDFNDLPVVGKRAVEAFLSTNGYDMNDVFRVVFGERYAWVWFWLRNPEPPLPGRHAMNFGYDLARVEL
jgi:hypothetical protein